MKRAVRALTVFGVVAVFGGCNSTSSSTDILTSGGSFVGSGTVATETRPVQGFTAVSVGGAGHLVLEQTGVESLEITADDNLLAVIRSEVVGGVLFLGFEPNTNVRTTREVLYRVAAGELSGITVSGASRAELVAIQTEELASNISGASSVMALGVAGVHQLTISGASQLDAPNLQSQDVTANLSGASRGLVSVSNTLTAEASGASSLQYIGHPLVNASTTGGSSVQRVER